MLINKKVVRANKELRMIQKDDKRTNSNKSIDRGGVLKRNIYKVVKLTSETPVGGVCYEGAAANVHIEADKLRSLLVEEGLTGNSGNGFPTADKIQKYLSADAKNKYIIINAAECEPGLINDSWLMRNRMKEIRGGIDILINSLKPDKTIFASRGTTHYISESGKLGLEIVNLPYKYPMGEEHILIQQTIGIKLDSNIKPAEMGILVINVQTAFQINRIVMKNYDGGHYVTVANLMNGEAKVAYVHEDTNISELLAKTFGDKTAACYAGGGIGRSERVGAEATFNRTISFAAIINESTLVKESPCKKCGGCTKKCPMGIPVKDVVLARQNNPDANISQLNIDKCIKCGTCAYFCPAGKIPMAYFS